MTQQDRGRNNLMISMSRGGSVPIVSQTEIDPMKTAISLILAPVTTTALTQPLPVPKPPGLGGSCPHGYLASGSLPRGARLRGDARGGDGRVRQVMAVREPPAAS
jgi:hypothetical protein